MRVLVVGAGIAGSVASLSMRQAGHEVTVVDAIAEPYRGGYQIQLDQTARQLLEGLGAGDVVAEVSAASPDIRILRKGRSLGRLRPVGYRLARRGELVSAVSRYAATVVPVRFGCRLASIEQRAEQVVAHFDDGTSDTFDLIVGADGLRSTVRRLVFGADDPFFYRNGYRSVWIDVPADAAQHEGADLLAGPGATAQIFPYPGKEEVLLLTSLSTGEYRSETGRLLPGVRQLLNANGPRFNGLRDYTHIVDPDRIRVTRFTQVRMPRWHAGRVVLIGDAAHCVDPLSGSGVHASLLSARTLADELRTTPRNLEAALCRYEARVRPSVKLLQHATAGLLEGLIGRHLRERLGAIPELLRATANAIPATIPRSRSLNRGNLAGINP
ncbi:putative FAD-dependent monooxygenase [Actinoplanes missouriensis 431]|uniref:Putative FAD-dependent monooxygenase n=1 Tax=Actinoplanes missouriensis (strain ATCC 14538 / DSM 43046 / CBS 188.64 / JCM 3121 / NBRC 102363 / NCIMB 12654 / NRRL B-3342 / UNCC 431) TaxID=512565 RepID=I0H4M0_ACTM4|nr:NAD(P)/FAD-dependent oxidoreductase [Actinoplanes missouriensis]BAL87957.1 putative FAD-dependent monooxygenase [Actinoplanes missouriensis 431]